MSATGQTLSIFLCHASIDKDRVRSLYHQLLNSGFAPWYDEVSLLPGQDWRQVIPQAVQDSDVVVVCLSNASMGKKGFVQKEINIALDVADEQPEGRIFIIPAKLEDCPVPARLSRWHWVELYKQEGFRNLLRALYSESVSRGLATPSALPTTESKLLSAMIRNDPPTTKVLFLAADPSDESRLRLGEELREIQESLQRARLRDRFRLEQRMCVRPPDISQALLDVQPQIVHFSGHGTAEGALCFEDEIGQAHRIRPDALAALFEQFADQVNCVVLNACFSEVQAEAVAHHITYVIGMEREIGDKAAIAFAIGFYQGLWAGLAVEEAYLLGRAQIRLQGVPEHLTPVLKSFGLTILGVLSRSGSGPRTKRGLRDDTGLSITTVTAQLNYLESKGYVSRKQVNGERWAITALGRKLVENTSHISSDQQ